MERVGALVDVPPRAGGAPTSTDAVDLLVLDEADPVARSDTTSPGRLLHQDAPTRWGSTQMGCATMPFDTEHPRRAELERTAGR